MSGGFFIVTPRTVRTLEVLAWLILGVLASLWWVPGYFGATHPISLKQGTGAVLLLWLLVFNEWPRVGTKTFFQDTPFLKLKFTLLGVINALFFVGLVL
jgi:hypothetical protein